MIQFLDKLFGYEYFGPILFAIIAFLIVLFFIILFFGKKDEKERILEETRRLELANLNAFKEEDEEENKLEIQEKEDLPEEKVLEVEEELPKEVIEKKEDEIIVESDDKMEETKDLDVPILTPISELPLITEETPENDVVYPPENIPVEETFKIEPSIPTNMVKYDFEELANSISRELEAIEKINSAPKEEIKEEKKEPEINIQESKVEVTPIKEIKKFKPSPVFSSVFVPQKEDINETKNEEKFKRSEDVKEEIKPLEIPVISEETKIEENSVIQNVKEAIKALETSKQLEENFDNKNNAIDFSVLRADTHRSVVKPKVELPKHIDMPKKVATDNVVTNAPNFEEIKGESYDLSR